MKLIRNLLALIGLVVVLAVAYGYYRISDFDPRFLSTYGEFGAKLLETGDPGVSMMWAQQVDEGLSAEEVIESLESLATEHNFLFVGESPFYKQVKAITGEDYRYVNFLSFCDARVGKRMLEYRDQYSGFMPCRIALVEDKDGRLWLYSMNLNIMIHGGRELPQDLKADALRVRDTIKAMITGAAKGEF
jgi:uncharacterized protein (DUF302 family)